VYTKEEIKENRPHLLSVKKEGNTMNDQIPALPKMAQPKKESGKGILALVLGCVGIGVCILWALLVRVLIVPVIAVIFGIVGLVLLHKEELNIKSVMAICVCVCSLALGLYSAAWQIHNNIEKTYQNIASSYYYYGSADDDDYEDFFNEFFGEDDSDNSNDIWWD
jgi:xanthosine utilization system XapX-like protein